MEFTSKDVNFSWQPNAKRIKRAINLSWQDVENACVDISRQIVSSGFEPHIVLPVLWGGAIPARLLIDMLDIKREDCIMVKSESYKDCKAKDNIKITMDYKCNYTIHPHEIKILIIEEIVDSGRTIKEIISKLVEMGLCRENIRVASLVWNNILVDRKMESGEFLYGPKSEEPDYYHMESFGDWVVFPWDKQEYFRAIRTCRD